MLGSPWGGSDLNAVSSTAFGSGSPSLGTADRRTGLSQGSMLGTGWGPSYTPLPLPTLQEGETEAQEHQGILSLRHSCDRQQEAKPGLEC